MSADNMISYIKALKQYESLIGLKEGGVLVLSILAVKIGLTLNKKSQRLLERWSSFQALFGEESIRVLVAGDHEFKLNYEANQSGKIGVNLVLRVPASESSDLLVFNQIFLKQEYQHVLDWFSSVGPRQEIGTIVDLGGNIGCAALFFSTQFPAASIFSLEPEASNYGRLRLNLELNSDRKIKSYHAAIWTQSCKLQCVHDFRDKKESSSRFVELSEAKDVSTQPVDALSIRSLMEMAGFKQIDLLKIDIEGAEAALFRDADFQNILKENVLRVAVEVHEEFIKIKEVEAVLHTLGYETNAVDEFLCGIKRKL
jgi:FkbM family methyltransferase